jgi:hypothetical protein
VIGQPDPEVEGEGTVADPGVAEVGGVRSLTPGISTSYTVGRLPPGRWFYKSLQPV